MTISPSTNSYGAPICGQFHGQSPTRKLMWSQECAYWYNSGYWTLRGTPRPWNMTFGYHTWNTSNIMSAQECEHIGRSAEFKSLTNQPKAFEANAFLQAAHQIGRTKYNNSSLPTTTTVISIVGDSVSRQTFSVLLEAIGIRREACTFEPLPGAKILFPTKCSWTTTKIGNSILNLTLYMHNSHYTDNWPNQTVFEQSDIVLMNFGMWYVEQQKAGQRTNHTPLTYITHMTRLFEDIQLERQPRQLIVFRETSFRHGVPNADLVSFSKKLHPLLELHQIPLITHHNSSNFTLFHDRIHFCEPSLPLAWITILTYMMQDWGVFISRRHVKNA